MWARRDKQGARKRIQRDEQGNIWRGRREMERKERDGEEEERG